MVRRKFIKLTTLSFATVAFASEKDEWSILKSVQEHLLPISKETDAIRYLKFVSHDSSFDIGDLDFLFRGAREVEKRGFKVTLKFETKEKILREFEKTKFGKNWLSMLLNYTIESVFADPIYGGNRYEKGWKKFHHHAGLPRPTKHFGKLS